MARCEYGMPMRCVFRIARRRGAILGSCTGGNVVKHLVRVERGLMSRPNRRIKWASGGIGGVEMDHPIHVSPIRSASQQSLLAMFVKDASVVNKGFSWIRLDLLHPQDDRRHVSMLFGDFAGCFSYAVMDACQIST